MINTIVSKMLVCNTSKTKQFEIPPNWVYRGEGNCNLVIALPNTRKVLRIRKMLRSKSLISWLLSLLMDLFWWYQGAKPWEELRDLKFYKQIMRPLLGFNYVCDGQAVFLSRKQVRLLEDELQKFRPDFRKHKELQFGRAALFDDYAFLPDEYYPFKLGEDTFSIEIKAKQGWTPFSERCFPKCYFCMNQYIKLQNGQISKISSYCPKDFFSGDKARMISAIKALIKNPQNNFRVFKNGKLCYGENVPISFFYDIICDFFQDSYQQLNSVFEEFCILIQKCLVTNFGNENGKNYCKERLFCEWNKIIQDNSLQSKLPKGCVLEKILSTQMLDVDGNEYYCKLLGNRTVKEFDYVRKLLKTTEKFSTACLKCSIMMLGDADESHSDLALVPYLISAVANDCSLMLCFRKINSRDGFGMKNVVGTKFGSFVVNVGVFDLYPKSTSTVRNHRKKISKMMQICLK